MSCYIGTLKTVTAERKKKNSTPNEILIGVFGHRHLEYKFGTVPAIKVQSLHVMASIVAESREGAYLAW